MHKKRWLFVLSLLLLTACVGAPPQRDVPPRPLRESIQQFSLEARASIKQATRADTLRLSWQHTPQNDSIGFASPLGNMMAELQRNNRGARWMSSDGEQFESANVDILMARLTDKPVPLDSLILWIVGRVSPSAQAIQRDAAGRLLQANDQGWLVSVQNYESDQANALPSLIEVQFETLRIRVAIEDWQI